MSNRNSTGRQSPRTESNSVFSMDKADRIMNRVFVFISWFSIVGVGTILVLTIADILNRLIFSQTISGCVEIGELMMVIVTFCALPIVTLVNGHIKVDLVVGRFSHGVQNVFKCINLAFFSVICCLCAYQSVMEGNYVRFLAAKASVTKIPYFPFYYLIALMLVISVLCALYNLVRIVVTGYELGEKVPAAGESATDLEGDL